MIKLSTSTTQTIKFIPRNKGVLFIELINESTNSVLTNNYDDGEILIDNEFVDYMPPPTTTPNDNYFETDFFSVNSFLQEGSSYILKAYAGYNDDDLVFYDKVFCTDQTDYTINKDEFKSYSQSETYKTFKG